MNLTQLRINRKVWRGRELSYWKKWWVARYHPNHKQSPQHIRAQRDKWWKLYEHSRQRRRWYDVEIAKKTAHVTGEEISWRGVQFIAGFEGYIGHVYDDGTGVMTVGYGHIENVPGNGWWVPGQKHAGVLSQPEAMRLLKEDLNKHYSPYVRALHLPLSQNKFDALVSFIYNVGPGAIGPGSGVGSALRRYAWAVAGYRMLEWNKAGGQTLPGLVRRREAERSLLLS